MKSKPWWLIFAVFVFFFRFLRFDTSNQDGPGRTPVPRPQVIPAPPRSDSRIPPLPQADNGGTPKSFDTILNDAIRSHLAKSNGGVPTSNTKPKSLEAIVEDAIRSRMAPVSIDDDLEFSFDTLPAEIVERMCDETTGLRESIADPEIRKNIESFMTRLMPEVGDEIRLRYRQSHRRTRTNMNDGLTPAAPRWLSQLNHVAASTLKERSNRANLVDQPVSALAPENGVDHP